MGEKWTFRPEYHLGDPAYSLFDPNGNRSAVGLILHDAEAICRAMNAAEGDPALSRATTQSDEEG